MLSEMLVKKKADKAQEDQLRQEKNDGDRNKILENVGKDFGSVIQPYIDKMGENSRMSAEELKRIIAESVQVTAPNVDTAGIESVIAQAFANLKFPEPKVNVAAPVIPAPVIKVNSPDVKFPTSMKLEPNSKPFPVIMMDQGGKPMLFPTMGSSGPGFPMQTLDAANNAIRVSVSSSNSSTQAIDSSGTPYSQANPFPVVFSSSATTASNIVDSSGVAYSGSNPVPVVFGASATQAMNMVDSSGIAYSGSNPVPVTIPTPVAQGDAASALRVILAGNADASVVVNSGTITTVTTLTGITNTIATALVDSSGVQYSGSNPFIVDANDALGQGDSTSAIRIIQAGDSVSSVVVNSGTITTVTTLTSITNTIAANIVDSSGVAYTTTNPLPVTNTDLPKAQGDVATALRVVIAGNSDASMVVNSGTITTVTTLTGVTNTVNVRLDTPDGIISAANPMQVTLAAGGLDSTFVFQARTTNPTAVADGADVRPKADKLGRTLTRPMQIRDLTKTAYVTLSTGTEATLLAAVAGAFLDCIWIAFANTSTAAVQVDVRATTAGNIVHTAYIPANSTVGWAPPVPWPQDNQGNNWTVDMGDFTNSNVLITALFSQEI